MNQHSASSSESERIGRSASGLVVGKSEWGEDGSSVRAREKRLKKRLQKWEKSDRLLRLRRVFLQLVVRSVPRPIPQTLVDVPDSHSGFSPSSAGGKNNFFRCSVVFPSPGSMGEDLTDELKRED